MSKCHANDASATTITKTITITKNKNKNKHAINCLDTHTYIARDLCAASAHHAGNRSGEQLQPQLFQRWVRPVRAARAHVSHKSALSLRNSKWKEVSNAKKKKANCYCSFFSTIFLYKSLSCFCSEMCISLVAAGKRPRETTLWISN